MSNLTVDVAQTFPNGTSVGAYLDKEQVYGTSLPLGTAVSTAVVIGGRATFTGLIEDESYQAIGQVASQWRRVGFAVNLIISGLYIDGQEVASKSALDAEAVLRVAGDTAVIPDTVGDGVTDDTANIQTAINAAIANGVRTVYLPAGTYRLTSALSIPNFLTLQGEGESSLLRCGGNHYAINLNPANRSQIKDLQIDAATTQTSGGGIDFTNAGSNIWVNGIYFGSNLFISLNVAPSTSTAAHHLDRLRWNGVTGCNTAIKIGGTALTTDVYIHKAIGTASTNTDMVTWLSVPSFADTIKISDSLFIKGGTGISLGATAQITNIKASNVTVDLMTAKGIDISFVRECAFIGAEISTCGAANVSGLDVGANSKGFRFIGGVIQNCGGYGVLVRNGSRDTRIMGSTITDNNTTNTGFNDGIGLGTAASDFQIIGNTIGNNVLLTTGHQKYGISIPAGASNRYTIADNHLAGNETSPITDGGTGTDKVIRGNLPLVVPVVASAATVTLPTTGDFLSISGTTNITGITASYAGRRVTLKFADVLTLTDGAGTIRIGGNFVTTADDTITLVCDGSTWFEVGRSVN